MRISTFSNTTRLIGLGTLLLLPASAWADGVRLDGDCYINPGNASNFGGLPGIVVGGATGALGLLLFDVTAIPPGSVVAWARLRVYVNNVTAAGAVDLFTASAPWSEYTVTGISSIAPGVLVQGGIALSGPGYVTIDVTSAVQSWINGAVNTGFLIAANPA